MKIRTALIAVLVGVAFYFGAKLGLILATPPDYIATFWPPNTVILAALLLTDRRRWWIYFLVMAPAYFIPALQTGYSMQRAIIFFPANCIEILVAALSLRLLFKDHFKLDQIRDMVMFLIFAVLIAPLISAFIASTATFVEPEVNYWLAWRVWFLGDALGHLMLTPVIILWFSSGFGWVKEISLVRLSEVLGLALCTLGVSYYALGTEIGTTGNFPILLYAPLPVLLWAALRFGSRGICSTVLVITLLAIWNAINGRGPFIASTPAENVLSLQLFLISISIPTMLLASIMSERKKTEKQLRKLLHAIEYSSATVMITDTKGNIEYTNPRFAQLTGYTQEEAIGKNPRILKSGKQKPEIYKEMWDTITSGREWKGEFCNKKKNGELYWESASISPVKNDEGVITNFIAIKEDITERKKMENALLQSEKLKSIGTITAGISHEFNNLLAIISGNVQLLEGSRKDDEELTDALRTIKRAANDGAEISRNMLKFTKIAKGTAGFVSFDIKELIHQAIDFTMPRWKNMAQAKGINYHMDTEGTKKVPSILCNPTELREVFVNIINNALDAMPDDGRITFRTWSEKDTVFISISDTGEGIPEEIRNNIFDPFFTTKTAVGTGLGMSTAYGIVTGHGGKIEVESKVKKGTTFNLQFPTANKRTSLIETPELEQEIKIDSLRILVVDDEKDVCNMLDNFFSRDGHKVKTVDNGKEAMELARSEDFDLVLTDMAMPNVFGYDVIRVLNESEKRPKIGIITGWGEKLKPRDEEGFEVDFIIRKPFDFSVLSKHINELGI